MFDLDLKTQPWQLLEGLSADEFLIGMLDIGYPQSITPVGAFADSEDQSARTAFRDKDLPWHRDGIRGEQIAAMQGGNYIEAPNVDVVGMYCLRDNDGLPCLTLLSDGPDEWTAAERIIAQVDLRAGEALVWDNRLWHSRRGAVGERMLIRFWTTLHDKSILPTDIARLVV